MLKKKYRLPIQTILNARVQEIKSNPYFSIKIFSSSLPYRRVGVIVSKKVFAEATKRNWLKRIVFETSKPRLFGSGDWLIIAKSAVSKLKAKNAIISELNKLL